MKKFYASVTRHHAIQKLLFAFVCIMPVLLHAQVEKVTLSNYQACGGATLVPNPFFGNNVIPATIYYERLVGADTWQLEGTQVYSNVSSFIQYNGDDIMTATTFRCRAYDEVSGKEYISNSVSVDPTKWNVDRGTAFSTAFGYFGSSCSNGYIAINNYLTTAGRPPFKIEYKKSSDVNYIQWGETANGAFITNIDAGVGYSVRVTDACGKVSNLGASLSMLASAEITQPTSTCSASDGIITVSTNGDNRYSGVAPFTYSVHKYGSTGPDTAYVTGNVFRNLSVGTYEYGVRDACNVLYVRTIVLGSGAPDATATYKMNAQDSCYNDVVIHTSDTGPFTYGLKPYGGIYTYQTDSVFKVSGLGYYYYTVKDGCNSSSIEKQLYVTIDKITLVDSTAWVGKGCVNDLKVYTSGALAPYTFYLLNDRFNSFQYTQTSDTFHNVTAGEQWVLNVSDRCGRYLQEVEVKPLFTSCYITVDTTTFESKNSNVGCADISGNDWIDVHDDNGRLIYSINPNGNVMNNVCWGVHIEENEGTPPRSENINSTPSYFIDRNFYIEPPANTILTDSVSVRLYITSVEVYRMTEYLSSLGQTYTINDLKILKKKGSPGSPVDLYVTNDSIASISQFTIITPRIVPYSPGVYYLEFKVKDFSEFNPYMGSLTTLAVNLLSLNASVQNKDVVLDWSATSDAENENFEVQWSDINNSFKTIGTVTAKRLATINQYSFTHTNAFNGTNYYRLKIKEKNGRYTYSKIVTANIKKEYAILIAPNPAHDKLTVQAPANNSYQWIKVYDFSGHLLIQQKASSATTTINVSTLANGMYVLQFDGDTTNRIKFVKY